MTIELSGVSKAIWAKGKKKYLFRDLDLCIEPGQRVGLLAQPKAGKSTLLRIICGTEQIDAGRIRRSSTVSWPIPFSDFLVPSSSVATNIRFVARLCGVKSEAFMRKASAMGELSPYLNKTLADCPRSIRPQLAFALGVSIDRDIYLFDEKVLPGREAKEKVKDVLKSLSPPAGIVIATSSDKEVAEYCDSVFVLDNGQLTYYSDLKQGIAQFKSQGKAEEISVGEADQTSDVSEIDALSELGL
jgi:capsular polysaccharide transport system ATP-binding protein